MKSFLHSKAPRGVLFKNGVDHNLDAVTRVGSTVNSGSCVGGSCRSSGGGRRVVLDHAVVEESDAGQLVTTFRRARRWRSETKLSRQASQTPTKGLGERARTAEVGVAGTCLTYPVEVALEHLDRASKEVVNLLRLG